jgi:hypothetical protein
MEYSRRHGNLLGHEIARIVFLGAGVWGIAVLAPLFWLVDITGRRYFRKRPSGVLTMRVALRAAVSD